MTLETTIELATPSASQLSAALSRLGEKARDGFFEIADRLLEPNTMFALLGIATVAHIFNSWRQKRKQHKTAG